MTDFACPYCGGTSQRRNQRDGWECANCGAPASAPGTVVKAVAEPRVQRRGRFTYRNGGILEIDEALRREWVERQAVVSQIKMNAEDFTDVAMLVVSGDAVYPAAMRTPLPRDQWRSVREGVMCGWYYNKYVPFGGQLVKIVLDPAAVCPRYERALP